MCNKYRSIKELMKQNIVVAVGCTEPVAVALCVAKAKEVLQESTQSVELCLSKNIIKNAMGVGIPGTGMIGLPIAVALGVVCGQSQKELEVLCEAKQHLQEAKSWLESHKIEIKTKDTPEKLYIECTCKGENHSATAIIAGSHTNFLYIERDNLAILDKRCEKGQAGETCSNFADTLSVKEIYDYVCNESLDELSWIEDTAKLNSACSQEGLKNCYGLQSGKTLFEDKDRNLRSEIIARTCAAADARMDGVTMPIYSNSGSGNQGIACTLPVYFYALKADSPRQTLIRALTLSHLMSIYIKSKIGRLSAMCGVTNASMGAVCGMMFLRGASLEQMCYAMRNMINTITGMVCDGAKPSCALKMATALNSAFDSMGLAMNNIVVDSTDGIAEKDIDASIRSLGNIGKYAMDSMDEMILSIMTNKKH